MKFPNPFFRKPRNRWYVQIDGKQHNLGENKEEAFRLYHELMQQAGTPVAVPVSPLVVTILDQFLTWEKSQRAKRTYDDHFWHIQRFINALPEATTLTISDFKPHHVMAWVDGQKGGNTFKRNATRAIKRAFSWAAEYGFIDTNPIAKIKAPAPTCCCKTG